jgi:diguanylate cyclase
VSPQVRQLCVGPPALTDPLTGLATRAHFVDRVDHAVRRWRRDGPAIAVLFAGLDDFKLVNDALGYAAADELLRAVSERFGPLLSPQDTLARVGADEYAFLLGDPTRDPAALADRILDAMRTAFVIAGRPIHLGVSLGLATTDAGDLPTDAATLIARADVAMGAAKRAGKNRLCIHDSGMNLPDKDHLRMRERVSDAVTDRQICLHYQPIVDSRTGRLHGLEALARWTDGSGTVTPPVRFLPIVETLGLQWELGEQLLELAVMQAARWSRLRGDSSLHVGVNLFPAQLADPRLPTLVDQLLSRYGVAPGQLVLEITEGAMLADVAAAVDVARRLDRAGVLLSLDDFGVGYSSLRHLQGFPLSSLKIDRGFIETLGRPKSDQFVEALIRMCHDLGHRVVAEGVEEVGQLARLQDFGCDFVQGYLLGRPQPPTDIDVTALAVVSVPIR